MFHTTQLGKCKDKARVKKRRSEEEGKDCTYCSLQVSTYPAFERGREKEREKERERVKKRARVPTWYTYIGDAKRGGTQGRG